MAPRASFGARAVGTYVPRVTKKSFEKFGFSTATLLTEWATIVGADLARMTAPDRVKWPRNDGMLSDDGEGGSREGATLVLRVDGPRALEIQYKTRLIIDRINAYFGYAAIGTVRILQAPLSDLALGQIARQQRPAKTMAPLPPPPDLAGVECDELRAALSRLHTGMASRRAGRRSS